MRHSRSLKVLALGGTGAAAFFLLAQGTALAAPYSGTSSNGFTSPVGLTGSAGLGEPSIIHDSQNRLFVTGPQAIGNINGSGGSPMFTSTDGGATWGAPVRSQMCTGLSGGDTDLAADGGDNIYQTDLWLGNSCLSVSTNHGSSFAAGDPFGSQLQPGDDRPWLAWNKKSNQIYVTYDGVDALHAANTASLVNPLLGIQTITDNVVVPESAINTSNTPDTVRECVCPPGGIAVDNSNGTHAGRVYISYSWQHGTAISYGDITGTCPVCGVTTWHGPIGIPSSGTAGSAFEDEWNMDPIKVDSNGTVYVMWGHAVNFNTNTNGAGSVQMMYAYSKNGGTTWSTPVQLSTEGGTTVFPTMDVVSPGVIDVSWYGDHAHTADPNSAAGPWDVYYARVTGADTSSPAFAPEVAIQDMHTGCIQSGGGASCSDRSLLDFFQITDDGCANPNIIYTGGDKTAGTLLYFTKLGPDTRCTTSSGPPPNVPEAPWAALLLAPAAAALGGYSLRRRRRARQAETG